MKPTITAKSASGFNIKPHFDNTDGTEYAILYDGYHRVMVATLRAYSAFCDEVRKGNNESAHFRECFRTTNGDTFIYWRDEETDEDFLSKVPDAPVFDEIGGKFWK